MPAWSCSGEGSVFGCRLPASCCVLTWWRAERKQALESLLIRIIPVKRAPPSCDYIPKDHLLTPSHWGLGFQHINFGEIQIFSPWKCGSNVFRMEHIKIPV